MGSPHLTGNQLRPACSRRQIQFIAEDDFFYCLLPEQADDDQSSEPLHLPGIPATLIENGARFLRDVWGHGGCCATWLLYLHPQHLTWHRFLAPQICTPDGATLDLTFRGFAVPGRSLYLAGSMTCCPNERADDLCNHLPVFDGIHIFWHPDDWLRLTCFVVAGGQPYPISAPDVLEDRRINDQHLIERICFADTNEEGFS